MKLVLIWASLVALAVATASSCSINHVSGEFTCTTSADCVGPAAGRMCNDGYCVAAGSIDAPKAGADGAIIHPDAELCPAQCTSCNIAAKSCNIECGNTNCTNEVDCPQGWNCAIDCAPATSCKTVNCIGAASCDISCSGSGSCRQVSCGAGACQVSCTGSESCRSVACGASCGCDVTCSSPTSCLVSVMCSQQACETQQGCTSQDAFCDNCP